MNHALLPPIATAALPEKYEAAKAALQACASVDECKTWADKAAALGSYARQSNDKELEDAAMRIRARAIKRCGELLGEFEKAHGANQNIRDSDGPKVLTRKDAGHNAGLSDRQIKDAIRVANVPEESFEDQVESDDPPTVTALANQGKRPFNGKPIYEKLGMTKEAFQAGMYFRGDLEDYAKATARYTAENIIAGSTDEERQSIRDHIQTIELFHQKLKRKL